MAVMQKKYNPLQAMKTQVDPNAPSLNLTKNDAELPENIKNLQTQRKGTLLETFNKAREKVKSQEDETRRLSANSLNRFAAISGVGSGAAEKGKQEAISNIERGFAQTQSDISAQEASALDQLAGAEQAMIQQNQGLQLSKDQLQFQAKSFDKQFGLMMNEFDENVKTNIFNKLVAISESNFKDPKAYNQLSQILNVLGENTPLIDPTYSKNAKGNQSMYNASGRYKTY